MSILIGERDEAKGLAPGTSQKLLLKGPPLVSTCGDLLLLVIMNFATVFSILPLSPLNC